MFNQYINNTMKKETLKTVIQIIVSILTAVLTSMGVSSCMGMGS